MTCEELIKRALRKQNLIALGLEPSSPAAQEGLEVLRSMYLEMVGNGTFGRFCDVILPLNAPQYTAREHDRITAVDLSTTSVVLPTAVNTNWLYDYGRGCDCATLYTDGPSKTQRPVRDGSIVTILNQAADDEAVFVYDGSTARWVQINTMELEDLAPLSNRYGDGMACELSVRLSGNYGTTPPPFVVTGAASFNSAITTRYDAPATIAHLEYM